MKILITSDAHGNAEAFDIIKKRHPNMDMYIDAGDSQLDPISIYPFNTIEGNCDYYSLNLMKMYRFDTPYGTLLMKHIPNVSIEKLKKENVKIFVYGHLHRRDFSLKDGIYFVSPGAISYERDSNNEGYCILSVEKESVEVEFFDL